MGAMMSRPEAFEGARTYLDQRSVSRAEQKDHLRRALFPLPRPGSARQGCIRQVESLDVADLELGSLRDIIAGGETPGRLKQHRALVHADHSAAEISAAG